MPYVVTFPIDKTISQREAIRIVLHDLLFQSYNLQKIPVNPVHYSLPPSAEVKNVWSYTSIPQYAFMVWCSVKAQGQLYLLPLPTQCITHAQNA
jgi:hypothetical protein